MENKKQIMVSIVIATYNSEKILPKVLKAIRHQSFPQDELEILTVDGGSADRTKELALKYGCRIIDNPKTEPVHAKLLGVQNAKGKYLLFLDHDEVLENKDSIKIRIEAMQKHPECKTAFCSGYKRPRNYPMLNQYLNDFGDPFSLFVYNSSKDARFFGKMLKKNFELVEEKKEYFIISFAKMQKDIIVELCCLGTIIDIEYFRETTNILTNPMDLVQLFYIMLEQGKTNVIVSKSDPLVHYSVDSLKAYLPKLKWRICNNVHFPEKSEVGFEGRQKYQKKAGCKKYLFVLYTIFFPISALHSVYLSLSRKNAVYLLHPFLCFYVVLQTAYQMGLKFMGIVPDFRSYDGKKKLER
ncbi:MAG: glycosyltransferase [Lachnospiraceae bacterium]|nr:glycosyltransferase [Lachnospiraceae bacterium]